MKKQIYLVLAVGLLTCFAQAKNVLFIGNSYTYLEGQGEPSNPMLPKLIKQIAESIDPDLQIAYASNTPGGWNFEKHFNDPTSVKLMSVQFSCHTLCKLGMALQESRIARGSSRTLLSTRKPAKQEKNGVGKINSNSKK